MPETRDIDEQVVAAASAARIITGQGSAVKLPREARAVAAELDLTAAASDATDTLDVYVQTLLDGTNWIDVAHFTQCLGNGGAKRYVLKALADAAQAGFETGAALGANAVRNLLGDQYRARWEITEGGPGPGSGSGTGHGAGTATFTFSVHLCAMP